MKTKYNNLRRMDMERSRDITPIQKNIDLAGKELHHWIPQRYRYLFKNIKGLSIDDPWNLKSIPKSSELHNHITKEWDIWSKSHPNPTIEEVLDKVAETISKCK